MSPQPKPVSLAQVREAARHCQECDLWARATQTVFGEMLEPGRTPSLMLVGEQPGDQEDRVGRPFIGPAGRLLDECLAAAGIDRRRTYVTNAVKHFKWVPRGKRRIHSKPSTTEVAACRHWLMSEIALVRPHVLVCLGATAAQTLLGSGFRVTQARGTWIGSNLAPHVMATVHPSSLLRMPREDLAGETARLIADLQKAALALSSKQPPRGQRESGVQPITATKI